MKVTRMQVASPVDAEERLRAREELELQRHGPPRPEPKYGPVPSTVFPPDVARNRRRRFEVQYGADFDLAREVRDTVGSLAGEVALLCSGPVALVDASVSARPPALWRECDSVASAVRELWAAIVRMLGEAGKLSSAARAAVEAALHYSVSVTADDMRSGSWVDSLVGHVAPLGPDLARLLGDSVLADGFSSEASDRLIEALRPLDDAVAELARRIPRVRQRLAAEREARVWQAEAESRRSAKVLAELGLG